LIAAVILSEERLPLCGARPLPASPLRDHRGCRVTGPQHPHRGVLPRPVAGSLQGVRGGADAVGGGTHPYTGLGEENRVLDHLRGREAGASHGSPPCQVGSRLTGGRPRRRVSGSGEGCPPAHSTPPRMPCVSPRRSASV